MTISGLEDDLVAELGQEQGSLGPAPQSLGDWVLGANTQTGSGTTLRGTRKAGVLGINRFMDIVAAEFGEAVEEPADNTASLNLRGSHAHGSAAA
eukprot:scaffold199065_cov38-Tisochrysis_lutea.AAC.1